jgi:hypothetical protein
MKKYFILAFFALILVGSPAAPQGTAVNSAQISIKLSAAPQQIVTQVTATTPNSFPLPPGTSTCIVTRNIAQSPGIDYNITASGNTGAVVFVATPVVGDVVQLNCW